MSASTTSARPWRVGLLLGLGLLALALLALALLAVWGPDPLGRAELLRQIESGQMPVIVDVRSRSEFESSHVPGAVHVPFHAILARTDEIPLPSGEGEPLVVYCERGPRAGIARALLWFVSDRPVRFLDGHMSAWRRDGLPISTAGGRWWK